MASISWSVVGMAVSEAERAQAIAAGEASTAVAALRPTDPPVITPGPGFPVLQPAGTIYPWGSTATPDDLMRAGYVYMNGTWRRAIRTESGVEVWESYAPTGMESASTVPSATALETSGVPNVVRFGAIIEPFVGGPLISVRLTTGIGAETGALSPIRMGVASAMLPRIIMNDVAT